ncbi:MAG: hypothetical protein LBI73_00945 [Myroides sp.]|nr:hypothetical protein [Myroides sp.]
MKQIYISCSFSMQKELKEAIDTIKKAVETVDYTSFVFIEQYTFDITQEREMMQRALLDIDKSCCLLAETTDKGIGIGIEAGYAKAQGKPVVYIRKSEVSHSTTMSGMADYHVLYRDTKDLSEQLSSVMLQVKLDVELREYVLSLLINEQATFTKEVLEYLKLYKAKGGKQDRAEEIVSSIAKQYEPISTWKDRADEVLDMITGYCSTEWRVWE